MSRIWFVVIICSLFFVADFAQAAPSPEVNLLASGVWYLMAPTPSAAALSTGDSNGAPAGGSVQKITVTTPSVPLWLIQISRPVPADIPVNDLLKFHFWARSATRNPVRVTVEQSVSPYESVIDSIITLTPGWKEYTLSGISLGMGPNGISAHFQVGAEAGTVEIAGETLTDIGVDPTLAAAEEALSPKNIQERIDQYRKGTLIVRVVDQKGHPVNGVTVKITQKRHAFLFGCNIFNLNPSDHTEAQTAYQNEFAALFNYATLPFYWGSFEYEQGKPQYDRLQTMADWCVAHNISPKGHPLIWHQVYPDWAPKDADQAIPLLKARVSSIIPHYKDSIHYWDVLNEACYAAQNSPPNGESNWIKRDGPSTVVATALDWARAAGAGSKEIFIYNDYNTSQPNIALLTSLQNQGKLPDAIGIQSHMHGGTWPLTKVWEICQTFSKFNRPIHFTETTVLSGPPRAADSDQPPATDWNTTPNGEASQAAYVAKFYTLLFSHPSVRAITWWDFSDRNSWMGAPSGMVRNDMSPKPVYNSLMELVHHQWWTIASGAAGKHGTYIHRAFYGDYTITATDSAGRSATVTASFPESAPPLTVTVKLP
jgi:GH35 family endo-1,4-beta-xylanase